MDFFVVPLPLSQSCSSRLVLKHGRNLLSTQPSPLLGDNMYINNSIEPEILEGL